MVRETSKEPISGEMALLTFLSNLGTFLVLIYWPERRLPAKGATRPNHETVQGHEGKLEGKAQNCKDTNTGDGNFGC